MAVVQMLRPALQHAKPLPCIATPCNAEGDLMLFGFIFISSKTAFEQMKAVTAASLPYELRSDDDILLPFSRHAQMCRRRVSHVQLPPKSYALLQSHRLTWPPCRAQKLLSAHWGSDAVPATQPTWTCQSCLRLESAPWRVTCR